jgi:hypothetical protein
MRHHGLGDEFLQTWIVSSCFSKTWIRTLGRQDKATDRLEAFVGTLITCGWVRIRTTETSERAVQYNGKDVLSLTWIPWWAYQVHQSCDYLQLDASFRCSRPYAYTAPEGLHSNEAVPLGFTFAPSESHFLYEAFFADLKFFLGNPRLTPKAVLCDGGLALAQFCLEALRKRFACHRHLIEAWCASYATGGFVARALRVERPELFDRIRQPIIAEARELLRADVITEKLFLSFQNFLLGTDTGGVWSHGIWDRIDDAIARCTQHAERFHGIVNQHLVKGMTFLQRLQILFEMICARFDDYNDVDGHPRRQLFETIKKMKEAKWPQVPVCVCPDCVQHCRIMNGRFKIKDFPCGHTVEAWKPTNLPPLPKFIRPSGLPPFRVDVLPVTAKACGYKANWLSASAKRPARPKVWDDEFKPTAPKFGDFLSTQEYEIVIGILRTMSSLWRRNPTNPKLDKKLWAMKMIDYLRDEFLKQARGPFRDWLQRHSDDDYTIQWIAGYSTRFAMWAAGDGDLPSGFLPPGASATIPGQP